MNCKKTEKAIVMWLQERAITSGHKGFVVGVSGGVDSAVVSKLCAMTSLKVKCLLLPIYQKSAETSLGAEHCEDLIKGYHNVTYSTIDLSKPFENMKEAAEQSGLSLIPDLSFGNMRSRLRMTMLYLFSNSLGYLVAGTGNYVEDGGGVGFFTKYGDGGVDISPIGNLTKTQVFELAKWLDIIEGIQIAAPTDGLFNDGRTDEDQLGATYPELEEAMEFCKRRDINTFADYIEKATAGDILPSALVNYIQRHEANAHKMAMPPIGPEAIL